MESDAAKTEERHDSGFGEYDASMSGNRVVLRIGLGGTSAEPASRPWLIQCQSVPIRDGPKQMRMLEDCCEFQ